MSDDPTDLEACINSKPLAFDEVTAPSMQPPTVTIATDVYVKQRWRQVQYLSDILGLRWTKEYSPPLQEPKRYLQVGVLVLLVDQMMLRNYWLLGRVRRMLPDTEGFVRRVKMKTKLYRCMSLLGFLLEGLYVGRRRLSIACGEVLS